MPQEGPSPLHLRRRNPQIRRIDTERSLTDWFDGSLHSPSRIGWYNVTLKGMFVELSEAEKLWRRRYWDGQAWSGVVFDYDSDEEAAGCMQVHAVLPEEVFWRGCTEEQFE